MKPFALLFCLFFSMGCERQPFFESGAWVDLSYDFAPDTIYWPTARSFELQVESAGRTPAGFYYAANNLSTSEHGGTHLDAPRHFAEGKWTTDEIPLDRLLGPGVVVDVTSAAAADADYQIPRAVLENWEREHGAFPPRAIVLFRTGWGRRWPDRSRYLGTSALGPEGVADLHFPGIHPDAARWLVAKEVDAVGIDTASIDHGQSKTFDSHQVLFAANVPAFENVAQLDRLPVTGSFVVALPMKIKGGSGGPLRIAAFLN